MLVSEESGVEDSDRLASWDYDKAAGAAGLLGIQFERLASITTTSSMFSV